MGLSGRALEDSAWVVGAISVCGAPALAPDSPGSHVKVEEEPLASWQDVELKVCSLCGGQTLPQLGAPRLVGGRHVDAWCCVGCWLLCDAEENPFEELRKADERWPALAERFAAHVASGLAGPATARARGEAAPRACGRPVLLAGDGGDPRCAAVAAALGHAFVGLCHVVDVSSDLALDRTLVDFPDIHRSRLRQPGQLCALLPSGTFVADVQEDPRILLYELKYLRNVECPGPEVWLRLEAEYMAPLRGVRRLEGGPCRQWLTPQAVALVARALSKEKFAVLDDFLEEDVLQDLIAAVQDIYAKKDMQQGRTHAGFHEADNRQGLLNPKDEPHGWSMRGDWLAGFGDGDRRAPFEALTAELDALVDALRHGGPDEFPSIASRLRHADFREDTMVACYPGRARGRYHRHTDDDHEHYHRRLTAILYLNKGWNPEDGGALRLFMPGHNSTQVRCDVQPIANRLLLFWSDNTCPHEVLSTRRDRFAATVWYVDSRESLKESEGLQRLLHGLQPVRPLSRPEALRRAAEDAGQAERLALLGEFFSSRRGKRGDTQDGDDIELQRYMSDHGLCFVCGRVQPLGAMGPPHEPEAAGRWFCADCQAARGLSFGRGPPPAVNGSGPQGGAAWTSG